MGKSHGKEEKVSKFPYLKIKMAFIPYFKVQLHVDIIVQLLSVS